MKPTILFLALTICSQMTIRAQKPTSNPSQPKEDIHVNREYDQNGNLIKFDTIFSVSFSGDTTPLDSSDPENFTIPFGEHF